VLGIAGIIKRFRVFRNSNVFLHDKTDGLCVHDGASRIGTRVCRVVHREGYRRHDDADLTQKKPFSSSHHRVAISLTVRPSASSWMDNRRSPLHLHGRLIADISSDRAGRICSTTVNRVYRSWLCSLRCWNV
jgi:hypothetical protein